MAVAVSKTDLARNTREIVEQVRHGQTVIVQSYGEEQIVLLDALDYRLLLAVVAHALGQDNNPSSEPISETIQQYLGAKISLSKAAELLGVSRFELMDRFERLGVPIRLGSETLAEAQQEIDSAKQENSSST